MQYLLFLVLQWALLTVLNGRWDGKVTIYSQEMDQKKAMDQYGDRSQMS